jgi:hypothetical protein
MFPILPLRPTPSSSDLASVIPQAPNWAKPNATILRIHSTRSSRPLDGRRPKLRRDPEGRRPRRQRDPEGRPLNCRAWSGAVSPRALRGSRHPLHPEAGRRRAPMVQIDLSPVCSSRRHRYIASIRLSHPLNHQRESHLSRGTPSPPHQPHPSHLPGGRNWPELGEGERNPKRAVAASQPPPHGSIFPRTDPAVTISPSVVLLPHHVSVTWRPDALPRSRARAAAGSPRSPSLTAHGLQSSQLRGGQR